MRQPKAAPPVVARSRPNPVDDTAFTRPLINALRGHVDALADTLKGKEAESRSIAVAWVFTTVLAAWAGDHHLIPPYLRAGTETARKEHAAAGGGAHEWLGLAFCELAVHPSTACLIDPRYNPITRAVPAEQPLRDLIDWWSTDAPMLAYDVEAGPGTLSGWLPGDVLQYLSDARRTDNALCQSPWWLADGIIDLTLLPAAREFRDTALRTCDPTAGTGHFLIRLVDYLWELYTTGSLKPRQMKVDGVTGWTPVGPAEAVRRIAAGVDGAELDPLTTATARLRMTVALGNLLHRSGQTPGPLTLAAIPHSVRPRVVCADSLLAHRVPASVYADVRPEQAAIVNFGIPDAEWEAAEAAAAAIEDKSKPKRKRKTAGPRRKKAKQVPPSNQEAS